MTGEIRSRVVLLLGLTTLAVVLAGVGTAFGVTPLTADRSDVQFVVSERNVTVSGQGHEETVLENTTNVSTIEITETESGQFTVTVEPDEPLTDAQRERAKEIARANETVQRSLDGMDEYELTVDPIYKIEADSQQQVSVTVTDVNESAELSVVEVDDDSLEHRNDTVVVNRDRSYVEDEAVVRVRQPSEDESTALKYSITVDLTSETVLDTTNWDGIRQDASTVDSTESNSSARNESIAISRR